jgi:hypothetical protein
MLSFAQIPVKALFKAGGVSSLVLPQSSPATPFCAVRAAHALATKMVTDAAGGSELERIAVLKTASIVFAHTAVSWAEGWEAPAADVGRPMTEVEVDAILRRVRVLVSGSGAASFETTRFAGDEAVAFGVMVFRTVERLGVFANTRGGTPVAASAAAAAAPVAAAAASSAAAAAADAEETEPGSVSDSEDRGVAAEANADVHTNARPPLVGPVQEGELSSKLEQVNDERQLDKYLYSVAQGIGFGGEITKRGDGDQRADATLEEDPGYPIKDVPEIAASETAVVLGRYMFGDGPAPEGVNVDAFVDLKENQTPQRGVCDLFGLAVTARRWSELTAAASAPGAAPFDDLYRRYGSFYVSVGSLAYKVRGGGCILEGSGRRLKAVADARWIWTTAPIMGGSHFVSIVIDTLHQQVVLRDGFLAGKTQERQAYMYACGFLHRYLSSTVRVRYDNHRVAVVPPPRVALPLHEIRRWKFAVVRPVEQVLPAQFCAITSSMWGFTYSKASKPTFPASWTADEVAIAGQIAEGGMMPPQLVEAPPAPFTDDDVEPEDEHPPGEMFWRFWMALEIRQAQVSGVCTGQI